MMKMMKKKKKNNKPFLEKKAELWTKVFESFNVEFLSPAEQEECFYIDQELYAFLDVRCKKWCATLKRELCKNNYKSKLYLKMFCNIYLVFKIVFFGIPT